jgi:50S ribosomal subunit-associated GTPase HflX
MIPKWVDALQQSCTRPPPVILLVNKMDLLNGSGARISDIERTYRQNFHGIFFVSTVTTEGIETAYKEAVLVAFRFQTEFKN